MLFEYSVVVCRVPAANVPGYTAACRLILRPLVLRFPTCTARCLLRHNDARDPSSERWNYWARDGRTFSRKYRLPRNFSDLSRAANLRHGADGFTSSPKEGVLRIFFRSEKSDGFGRDWNRELTKGQHATSRPHQSRFFNTVFIIFFVWISKTKGAYKVRTQPLTI